MVLGLGFRVKLKFRVKGLTLGSGVNPKVKGSTLHEVQGSGRTAGGARVEEQPQHQLLVHLPCVHVTHKKPHYPRNFPKSQTVVLGGRRFLLSEVPL